MASTGVKWRVFSRLIPCLLAVIVTTIFCVINYDPFFKRKISEYISYKVSEVVHAPVQVEFEYFNPFTATLSCTHVRSSMYDWSCAIPRISFRGSWISLLSQCNFDLECVVESGSCTLHVENKDCSLINIVNDFLKVPSKKPLIVTSIILKECTVALVDKDTSLSSSGSFSLTTKMVSKHYFVQHVVHSLQTMYKDLVLFNVTNGSGELLLKEHAEAQGSLYYTIDSVFIPHQKTILYGVYSAENKYLNVYSTDRQWDISLSYQNIVKLSGHLPLTEILRKCVSIVDAEAEIAFDIQWDEIVKAELLCNKIKIKNTTLEPIKLWCEKQDDRYSGSFLVGENDICIQGSIDTHNESCTIQANSCLPITSSWISFSDVEPFTLELTSDYTDYNVKFSGLCKSLLSPEYTRCTMNFHTDFQRWNVQGDYGEYAWLLNSKNDTLTFNGTYLKSEILKGTYAFESKQGSFSGSEHILKLIGTSQNVPVTGKGTWQINTLDNHQEIQFSGLVDGQFRIGDWYNIVEKSKIHGLYNSVDNVLQIQNFTTQFRAGSLAVNNAVIDTSKRYCSLPLKFDNVLITKQNEFFAQVNGYGCLNGSFDALTLKGFCMVDKSLITGNILSSDLYKETEHKMHVPIECDCLVLTKTEVPIKTPLFATNAHCLLHITGQLMNPRIDGTIDFSNGSIYFPYDALFIKTGLLTFNSVTSEPSIELVAKNSIKNYDITLGLHGGIHKPLITLTSSPLLAKDQLIALLLGGSEDGSLSLIMPQSITELFEQLLFGSTATISKTQKFIQSFFEPLKSVRLVPKFSDQTGRGGLRGALEIDVTDRLKASIQQNFSLTEDTRIDISYALSDEANIKATKDERGDVGCEVEMKWRW